MLNYRFGHTALPVDSDNDGVTDVIWINVQTRLKLTKLISNRYTIYKETTEQHDAI